MPPPAVIGAVVREFILIMELEIAVIRAVLINISALFITWRIFIDPFSVQPFIERSAMIEHAVQNDFHASPVGFFHHFRKKFVACFQIFFVGDTINIAGG